LTNVDAYESLHVQANYMRAHKMLAKEREKMKAKKSTKTAKTAANVRASRFILNHEMRSDIAEIAANVAHSTMTRSKEYDRLNPQEAREYLKTADSLAATFNKKYAKIIAQHPSVARPVPSQVYAKKLRAA
jgi:hypothetical protein